MCHFWGDRRGIEERSGGEEFGERTWGDDENNSGEELGRGAGTEKCWEVFEPRHQRFPRPDPLKALEPTTRKQSHVRYFWQEIIDNHYKLPYTRQMASEGWVAGVGRWVGRLGGSPGWVAWVVRQGGSLATHPRTRRQTNTQAICSSQPKPFSQRTQEPK